MSPSTQIMWRWTGFWMCLKAQMKMERYSISLIHLLHLFIKSSVSKHRFTLIKALTWWVSTTKMSDHPLRIQKKVLTLVLLMHVSAARNFVPGEVVFLALRGQHVGAKSWHWPREDWRVWEGDGAWAGAEACGKSCRLSCALFIFSFECWARATFLRLHGNH